MIIDPRDPLQPQVITGGDEFRPWETEDNTDGDAEPPSSASDWPETPSYSRLSTADDGAKLGFGRIGEIDDRRETEVQDNPATGSFLSAGPMTVQRTQYEPLKTSSVADEEPQLNRPRLAEAAAERRRAVEREDAVERQMQARAGERTAEETRRLTAPSGRDLADTLDDLGRSNELDQDVDELRRLRLEALAKPGDELTQLRFENKKFKLAEKISRQLPVIVARYGLDAAVGLLIGLLPGAVPSTIVGLALALARGGGSAYATDRIVDSILESSLEHAIKQPPKNPDRSRTPEEATRALAESGRYGVYRERESPDQRAYGRLFKPPGE